MLRVGVIGCGSRARGLLRALAKTRRTVVTAIADPDPRVLEAARADGLVSDGDVRHYREAGALLEQEELDGVVVATRGRDHADLACSTATRGLPLLLEKPVGTSVDDLLRLAELVETHNERVVVS